MVAPMIGDIRQCYSPVEYCAPQPTKIGMFLERGCPKSLFRPGSSTTAMFFQRNRAQFSPDLMRNLYRTDVKIPDSQGLGRPLVETDIKIRWTIGQRKKKGDRR